jgi:hypothetical protein
VAARGEEVEEALADVVTCHFSYCSEGGLVDCMPFSLNWCGRLGFASGFARFLGPRYSALELGMRPQSGPHAKG